MTPLTHLIIAIVGGVLGGLIVVGIDKYFSKK